MFIVAALAISVRRWPQLVSPDVWVEDGTQVIPSFVEHGWWGLFAPISGYLLVPSKIVSYLALSLTFSHYAIVSTAIAILTQAAVVAAIATAPTLLSAPIAAALLVPFLPIASEVYGLPSYTFWWTTLLVIVGLFWRGERGLPARMTAIVVSGLSSPFVLLTLPVFALRAAIERTRGTLVALCTAVAVGGAQALVVLSQPSTGVTPLAALGHPDILISKYFGTALFGMQQHGAGLFGVAVIVLLAAGVIFVPKPHRLTYVMLGLCLCAAIASSVSRVPIEAPHPRFAGPRYFFLPSIFLGWMLLMLAMTAHRLVGLAAVLAAAAYIPLLATDFLYEPQVPKRPWPEQAADCLAAPGPFTIDVQYGIPSVSWSVVLQGEDCRKLEKNALF